MAHPLVRPDETAQHRRPRAYRREALASAEVWDPTVGSCERVAPLTLLSGGTRAALLPDGRVFLVGDISDADPEAGLPPPVAEMWDPATVAFSPAGSLSGLRGGQTITALSDGRVLVVGGCGEGGRILASAEICGPGSISQAAALP